MQRVWVCVRMQCARLQAFTRLESCKTASKCARPKGCRRWLVRWLQGLLLLLLECAVLRPTALHRWRALVDLLRFNCGFNQANTACTGKVWMYSDACEHSVLE